MHDDVMFGAVASNRLWTVPPSPFEGESLSSWFVRLAHGNGIRPTDLYRAILPGGHLYQQDFDRTACDAVLESFTFTRKHIQHS